MKAAPQTLLVASLPEAEIEVGGEGGRAALERLERTFSRVESSWQPASPEEGYEIVRRRLFKDIPGDKYKHRDHTLNRFAKLYRENPDRFPHGCADQDYRRKLEKAYPIHPDLFDHLYLAWGSLERFQRTRGVLRLMAQVIHELWMNEDPSALIMPGSVAVNSDRVEPELLHYLDRSWQSIIAGDVDGTSSVPYLIDRAAPNLNKHSATRRVARAIFIGSAPTHAQKNPGLDDKRINLGVAQPGEPVAVFGDALRRLADRAKFMHADRGRYRYSMSPNLNRLASDRAAQLEEPLVLERIDKALKDYIGSLPRGQFDAVQVAPNGSADIPDEAGGVRAVVLGVAHPHRAKGDDSAAVDAMAAVNDILRNRGETPRIYLNTLVFLAADDRRLENLKAAMRASLAWDEIAKDTETKRLDLRASQIELARDKAEQAGETLQIRLKETWCYLIYPDQETAQSDMKPVAARISAQDGILDRVGKKLVSDEALLPTIGPDRLNRELEKYVWNDKPHLHLNDVWQYLNCYTYLPRLKDGQVLIQCVQSAVSGMLPGPFAYAERWDEASKSYAGLAIEQSPNVRVSIDADSVIVGRQVAAAHRPAPPGRDQPGSGALSGTGTVTGTVTGNVAQPPPGTLGAPASPDPSGAQASEPETQPRPKRFAGTVKLSADRPARDMSRIVEAIVEQLTALPDAEVSLKLEIRAEVRDGLDRNKVRTLLENAATLNFLDKSVD